MCNVQLSRALKHCYLDIQEEGKDDPVVYGITFHEHLMDDIYLGINFIYKENLLFFTITRR